MPDWREAVRERVKHAGLSPTREAAIVEEIAAHLDDRYRDLVAQGESEPEAVRRSLREIDARLPLVPALKHLPAEAVPPPAIAAPAGSRFAGLGQDVRHAIRLLRKSPGFSIAAIVTIALSTAPTITALGLANWLFFRPVSGIVEPDRLATVWFGRWSERGSHSPWRISYEHLGVITADRTVIQSVAGVTSTAVTISVNDSQSALKRADVVTANYFDVLGVPMLAGRTFRADEDAEPGGATVTILDAGFAQSLFGTADAAVNQRLRLNGMSFLVVGVASPAFRGTTLTRQPSLWLTGFTMPRVSHFPSERWTYEPGRGPFSDFVLRLAPGATFDQADARLRGAARALGSVPGPGDIFRRVTPTLFPKVGVDPFSRQPMWELVQMLLWVGVALVVLGAANLANLFAFRSRRRVYDAAVRRALGASGARLARLPFLEALLLAVAGGGLGLWLTLALRSVLDGVSLPGFGTVDVPIDWTLVAMALGVSIVIGLLLSVLPARLAVRADLALVLGRSHRTSTHAGGVMRTGLAVVQVALSLTLLVGALLLLKTLQNLRSVDLGFDATGVSEITLALQPQGYVGRQVLEFQKDVIGRLAPNPAIEAASLVMYTPFRGASFTTNLHLPDTDPKSAFEVTANDVSPRYFDTLRVPLIAGRTFTEAEAYMPEPEPGVLVSASLAAKLFGQAPAVGRLVRFPAVLGQPAHNVPVIGVVGDVHWRGFERPDLMLYRPIGASGRPSAILIRSARPASEVLALARAAVRQIDRSVPVNPGTLTEYIGQRMARQQLLAWVFGVLAAIGFALAAVGIHGLVSQSVVERLREFGIRRAIGAGTPHVATLVLRYAFVVIAIGVPLGLVGAGFASRLIRGQLFGITPLAPAVYLLAAAGLAAVVCAACIGPARRAVRVDPVEVLRAE